MNNLININNETTPTKSPTRTPIPTPIPHIEPDTRKRYNPDEDHCPAQRLRTVRRIRPLVEPN